MEFNFSLKKLQQINITCKTEDQVTNAVIKVKYNMYKRNR